MEIGTARYRKALLILYIFALLLGISASALGLYTGQSTFSLHAAMWPLWGIFSGMLFMGAGALLPLFLIGTSFPLNSQAPFTAINTLAFLYGASAGTYLALYYLEFFETGAPMDETLKHNFKVRAAEAILISAVPVLLRAGF